MTAPRAEKPRDGVPHEILKRRAHGRVHSQIKAGLMVRPDRCSHCNINPGLGKDGRSLMHAHHHKGYEHPIDVEWLCVDCHRAETPCNPLRGELVANSKLSEDIVRVIRTSKESSRTLGRQYGVDGNHIRLIAKRKSWTHLP